MLLGNRDVCALQRIEDAKEAGRDAVIAGGAFQPGNGTEHLVMGGEIEVNAAEILVVVVHRGQIDDVVDIVGAKLRVRLRVILQPQLCEWAETSL